MKLFCFGFGYVAHALAALMPTHARPVCGTQRNAHDQGCVFAYQGDGMLSDAALQALAEAEALLVSIPPDQHGCPVARYADTLLAQAASIRWIGYLSTTSVYGDTNGQWVDETAPLKPTSDRARQRIQAEQQWQDWGIAHNVTVQVFRLSGIYGPGRSPFERIACGEAQLIDAPGHVFNRIHVDDIAQIIYAGMQQGHNGIYNVSDDVPAAQSDVLRYAYDLLGQTAPPAQSVEAAALSPMAQEFYRDCKRVCNDKVKQELGVTLLYPTYIDGLNALYSAKETQPCS